MSSRELRAAVSRAVLRDANGGGGGSGGRSSRPGKNDVERLRAALKAVAAHAAVDGRRRRVLDEGGPNLVEAMSAAAASGNAGLLRLAALVFARLSAEADACRVLCKEEFLGVLERVLCFDVAMARTGDDVLGVKEARRLAARGARNLAAFDEQNAVCLARESDVVRLLLGCLQEGIATKTSGETVEAAAAIANLCRYGLQFQAYIRKHAGMAILASAAQHEEDAAVVFHSVRALAEFSLEHRWQVQLVGEGVVDVAVLLIRGSRDGEIVSEATRCIGNIAATRTGREAILHAGGVEAVVRRVVMMSAPGAGATREFRVKSSQLRLAADLLRAMANLCVGSKDASQRVISGGGVMALIAACDQEAPARLDPERAEAIEAVKTEAFRGLLIVAQGGSSFRATVLREIGLRTRNDVALGRCTAHLYDLARRIKVEASAEQKDDVPQTIAGLGEASKDYLFKAGPLARGDARKREGGGERRGGEKRSGHAPPNSLPGLESPSTAAFRQSGRVLSVQRPQHHRARLEHERRQRIHGPEMQTCSCITMATGRGYVAEGEYTENGRMSSTFASSTTGASAATTACPDCRKCSGTGTINRSGSRPHSDVSPIPRCRVVDKPGRQAGDKPARVDGGAAENDTGGSDDNWAMQVWSFVCKPLARPQKEVKKPMEELEEDVFEIGTPLGRGGFATVFLAKNLRTDELVAVKRFHPIASALPDAKKKAEMAARRALKEQRIWDGLTHRNVVAYKGCFFGEEGELNLVAEYIPGWSLADHLSQINKFPEHLVARITKQIVDGLDYLHREGVTHRDIKPANILVDPTGVIKLTDFGVSSALDVPTMTGNTLVGTPHFIAPEMIEGRPYNKSVDIWSLGCTVLELATGRRPYHDLRAHEALFRIAQDRRPPPIPSSVSPPLRDFLKTCWVWDPEKRPLTAHLKRHPFLAKI